MKPYTAADAQQEYPPKMRRGQVMELGRKVGVGEWTMKSLLDPGGRVISRIVYPGTTRAFYDRSEVIKALFTSAPAQPAMAS